MVDPARTRALARALRLRRNAAVGFGVGGLLAAAAYVFRVGELAGPVPDARGSPTLFVLLAVVLAVTVGAVVTVALTLRTAVRLAGEADDADP